MSVCPVELTRGATYPRWVVQSYLRHAVLYAHLGDGDSDATVWRGADGEYVVFLRAEVSVPDVFAWGRFATADAVYAVLCACRLMGYAVPAGVFGALRGRGAWAARDV